MVAVHMNYQSQYTAKKGILMKYIVKIENSKIIENLKDVCSHIGNPKVLQKLIVIESAESAESLLSIEGVIDVEEDKRDEPLKIQKEPKNWALPQICGQDNKYVFKRTGKNVDIYIMDSGIRCDHEDFNGRVETVFSFDGLDYGGDIKSPSHGTSCASMAAGKYYGIAKDANIKNVRYNWSTVEGIKAFDAILNIHLNKKNKISILHMGFATKSKFYFDALQILYENGIILVSGSGNTGLNKESYPASFDFVISVGASDENYKPARFTNWGKTCDIFAPGVDLILASIESKRSTTFPISGTSFSCSCVVGLISLICENAIIEKKEGVDKAKQLLLKYAWKDKIIKCENTTSLLVNSNVKNSRLDYRKHITLVIGIGDNDLQVKSIKRGIETPFTIKTDKFHYVVKILGPSIKWDGETYYTDKLYEDTYYKFQIRKRKLNFVENIQYLFSKKREKK